MRRIISLAAAGTLAIAAAVSAPVIAQQQDQQNSGNNVLGQILDRILGPAPAPTPSPTPAAQGTATISDSTISQAPTLAQVLTDRRRGDDWRRDTYRHPAETLDFFRVQPGMRVVDYMPNGWWYTRILVPWLGPNGSYIGMNPDVRDMPGYWENTYSNVGSALAAEHAKWASASDAAVSGFNTDNMPQDLDGTVDRVLIIREVHNMFRYDWMHHDLEIVRRLLKPDGLVGVIDHRAKADAPYERTDGNKGYMREADMIALFDAYGFDLVAQSEINANPKDPTTWEQGVWELPPSLINATDASRSRRQAVGESDRMTLLFRKRD